MPSLRLYIPCLTTYWWYHKYNCTARIMVLHRTYYGAAPAYTSLWTLLQRAGKYGTAGDARWALDVTERIVTDPDQPSEGVSGVKASRPKSAVPVPVLLDA